VAIEAKNRIGHRRGRVELGVEVRNKIGSWSRYRIDSDGERQNQ